MAFPKPLLFPLVVSLLSVLLFHTLYTKKSFPQSENPWKHVSTSEAVGKAYELQRQIFELRQEMEVQRKRILEVETRAKIADKKVAELSSKLENIDVKWFLSKLSLNSNKTQEYLMTIWNQRRLSQTLQKVRSMTIAKPHLEKVQVALGPYTENLRYGFEKLVNSTKSFGKTK